jgi:hypothetical protein
MCSGPANARGVLRSVVKAPISNDGDTTGAWTDLVLNLAVSPDPNVPGLALTTGTTITVTLPPEFTENGSVPLANVGSSPDCAPGNLECSTGVLLQGWPQNPVPPPNYTLSANGNAITYTLLADVVPNAPAAPGVKQAHLILRGWDNPAEPGWYAINMEIDDGNTVQTGFAPINIRSRARRSINVTSVFADEDPNPPNPNTIYQEAPRFSVVPLNWDFLLWDAGGAPLADAVVEQVHPHLGLILKDGRLVGDVLIRTPQDAYGQALLPMGPSIEQGGTPVLGPGFPTARLTVGFLTGSRTGRYDVRFRMLNGTSTTMVVRVR